MTKNKFLFFKKKEKGTNIKTKSHASRKESKKLKKGILTRTIRNMKVKNKLFTGFAIIIIFFAITVVASLMNIKSIVNSLSDFYNELYAASNACVEARNQLSAVENSILRMISTKDKKKAGSYADLINGKTQEFQDSVEYINTMFKGDEALLEEFRSNVEKVVKTKDTILNFAEFSIEGAAGTLETKCLPALDAASECLAKIQEEIENDIEVTIQNSNKLYKESLIAIGSMFIIGVIFALLAIIIITKNIVNPVKKIQKVSEDMASGKLNTEIDYLYKDELGSLSANLNQTTSTLSTYIKNISETLNKIAAGDMQIDFDIEYLGDFQPIQEAIKKISCDLSKSLYLINESSEQVATGADQVASGSQALSSGSIQQASAIDSLSASIEAISDGAKKNSESANNASKFSIEVQKNVEKGNKLMQDMLQSMEEISTVSGEISKIVKNIDDIAFQTNILALNAAVEAARAGDAGRGFAVVANEVGNLAGKSAESAENTTTLINNTIDAIKRGTVIADETARALASIVKGTQQSTVYINQIVDASNEQLESIESVLEGVEQISGVIQTNSATAEESAAASEELASQASALKNEVGKFKLAIDSESFA